DLIGPLLYGSDVVGLAVGVGLILALLFLRRRGEVPLGGKLYLCEGGVGGAVLCAAVNYWVLTPRLQALQGQLPQRYGGFHQADKADPLYLQFNGLHQTSTAVFMVGFVAALVCLVCLTQFRSRSPVPQAAGA